MEKVEVITVTKDIEVTTWYCDTCGKSMSTTLDDVKTEEEWGTGCYACHGLLCKTCMGECYILGLSGRYCPSCVDIIGLDKLEHCKKLKQRYYDASDELEKLCDAIPKKKLPHEGDASE